MICPECGHRFAPRKPAPPPPAPPPPPGIDRRLDTGCVWVIAAPLGLALALVGAAYGGLL